MFKKQTLFTHSWWKVVDIIGLSDFKLISWRSNIFVNVGYHTISVGLHEHFAAIVKVNTYWVVWKDVSKTVFWTIICINLNPYSWLWFVYFYYWYFMNLNLLDIINCNRDLLDFQVLLLFVEKVLSWSRGSMLNNLSICFHWIWNFCWYEIDYICYLWNKWRFFWHVKFFSLRFDILLRCLNISEEFTIFNEFYWCQHLSNTKLFLGHDPSSSSRTSIWRSRVWLFVFIVVFNGSWCTCLIQ